MKNNKIEIIIPFYNGDNVIENCLDSIKSNKISQHIYLINNSDRATKIHEIAKKYDGVDIIDTAPRLGFGRANNIGAKKAISGGAEIIISINQDTILDANCITELLKPFQVEPHISITAPLQFTYDFSGMEGFFVKYYLYQCPEIVFDALHGSLKDYYAMLTISGGCFAIRSATILKYGFFDSLYFMYAEDDDLCRRLGYTKNKIVIVPKAKIAHKHGNTAITTVERDRNYKWQRYSRAVYQLKDIKKSLFMNILIVLRDLSRDYLNILAKLSFKKILIYFLNDLVIILKIMPIIRSRSVEKKMMRNS